MSYYVIIYHVIFRTYVDVIPSFFVVVDVARFSQEDLWDRRQLLILVSWSSSIACAHGVFGLVGNCFVTHDTYNDTSLGVDT